MAHTIPQRIRPLRDKVLDFVEKEIIPQEQVLFSGGTEYEDLKAVSLLGPRPKACGPWGTPPPWGDLACPGWIMPMSMRSSVGRMQP